ncbi:MAG: M28 family peptidase, partial [Candidatus Latescibacteria bacterium]|nr:M28 family peptidase [Candidatus Latescibacterota bacterium]
MRHLFLLLSHLSLLLLLCLAACRPAGTRTGHVTLDYQTDYAAIAAAVDSTRIRQSITRLAGFGSRMTGYPGADSAAQYLVDQFTTIGLEDVKTEEFIASVPLDEGGELTLLDPIPATFPLSSLWPNLIRTSTLPPGGLTGRLYYVGRGDWADFNGKNIVDQIVLMEFNTSTNWENTAILGARAVIFVEPDWTTRVEGEEKYFQVPINFPRFWMRKQDAHPLVERLRNGETLHVRAKARMTWKRVPAYNVLGKITGTHPQLKDESIVLESYYDSISPVPAVSPGANQATGIVALLEMARYFRAHPPARTVYFLATSGHFLSLSGVSAFANRHTRKTPYFAERLTEPIDMK